MVKIPQERKQQYYAERDSCNNRFWIYNSEGKHKRIHPNEIEQYKLLGWKVGRLHAKGSNGKFIKNNYNEKE